MNKPIQVAIIVVVALFAGWFGFQLATSIPMIIALPVILLLFAGFGFYIWKMLNNNVAAAPASAEANADAKRLAAPAGKARIYIYRQKAFMGMAQGMDVAIREVGSGQLKGANFVMADVNPGTYTITGNMAAFPNKKGEVQLTLAPGDVAVVEASMQADLTTGSVVVKRVDAAGHESIRAGQLIDWGTAV